MVSLLRALLFPFINRHERRPRALWRLLLQVMLLIVIVLPFSFLPGVQDPLSPVGLAVQCLAVIISVFLAAKFLDRRKVSDLGLHQGSHFFADLLAGLALGFVAMTAILVGLRMAGWVEIVETAYVSEDADYSFGVAIFGFIIAAILVGFYEELLTRGYQMRNLAEGFHGWIIGPRAALIISWVLISVLFSAFHLANPNASVVSFIMIAGAGLLLGLPVVLTGNLGLAIGLHITWNFFQGAYGFGVSGVELPVALIKTESTGPAIWTGGEFGPEAGLSGLAGMFLCTVLILAWVHWRYGQLAIAARFAVYSSSVNGPPTALAAGNPDTLANDGSAEPGD